MDVAGGPDDAIFHFQDALGAHDVSAGCSLDVAGHFYRQVDAELDGIREGQFNLRQIAFGTQNTKIRDDAFARADEGHRLFGRELTLLIEPFVNGEPGPFAEKDSKVFRRDVHVPGGAVGHEHWRVFRCRRG